MNDLKNIKDILNNYEVEYNPKDWVKLEKSLPKAGMSGFVKTTLVASAVIIMLTAAIFIINSIDKDKNQDKEIISQSKTEQIISDNSNFEQDNNTINNIIEDNQVDENTNLNKIVTNQKNNEESEYSTSSVTESENSNEKNHLVEEITNFDETTYSNENETKLESHNTDNTPDLSKLIVNYEILSNCTPAKIIFKAQNVPENCEAIWNTGDNSRISGRNVEYIYNESGVFFPEVNIIYNNFILKNVKLNEIELNNPTNVKINFENSKNSYYFTSDKIDDLDLVWTIENQNFRSKELSYNFDKEGVYMIKLTGTNKFGCKSEVSKNIIIAKEQIFFVPNAFTPNSNDINSHFGPIGENLSFASYLLIILDSNGTKVFESDKPEIMWNGKINNIGNDAKSGIYLWEIRTVDNFGNYQNKKGRVNLIRN